MTVARHLCLIVVSHDEIEDRYFTVGVLETEMPTRSVFALKLFFFVFFFLTFFCLVFFKPLKDSISTRGSD